MAQMAQMAVPHRRCVASRVSLAPLALALAAVLLAGCGGSDQGRAEQRRDRARQSCENAVRDQLASRATATFSTNDEPVYYDSTGGAAVTGLVATATGQRKFACVLKSASDSSWSVSAARMLN